MIERMNLKVITYINKSNANDYRKLFDKATEVLIQGGLSEDAAQINSLEEYFAQIKTIVEWSNDRRYSFSSGRKSSCRTLWSYGWYRSYSR